MLKIILLIFAIFISSCKKYDKNTEIFMTLLSREEFLKEKDPKRVFNPNSAMLIATLPNRIGNMFSTYNVSDFEIMKNGLGYSKRYKNNLVKKGYWIDVFAYNNALDKIPDDIDNNVAKKIYNQERQFILTTYQNSRILENNIIIFNSPSNKNFTMYETIFEYFDIQNKEKLKMFLYFTVVQDSFLKIRITYKIDSNEPFIFKDKELFLKDFGYYFAEGMSLKDFNNFKKLKTDNSTTMQRIKK